MRANIYISFGAWLIIVPFLGIPVFWRNILIIVSGVCIIFVALRNGVVAKNFKNENKTENNNDILIN
jgi:hypothetical protein